MAFQLHFSYPAKRADRNGQYPTESDTWTRETVDDCYGVLAYLCKRYWDIPILGRTGDRFERQTDLIAHFFEFMKDYGYNYRIFEVRDEEVEAVEESDVLLLTPKQVQIIGFGLRRIIYSTAAPLLGMEMAEVADLAEELKSHFSTER